MWNKPTREQLNRVPELYATEETPMKDKLIYLHFFIGGCDWYISEYDGGDLFFGFAILNNDLEMAEWGPISFSELRSLKVSFMEVDCEKDEFWKIRPAHDVENIKLAQFHLWKEQV